MKKFFLMVLWCVALSVHADVIIPANSTIDADVTWSPEQGVYLIRGKLDVSAGATLTIKPGTIVKFEPGGSGVLNIFGSLDAHGTSDQPIYFTSLNNDSIGGDTEQDGTSTPFSGDWEGLYFKPDSKGKLLYVDLGYGGYGGYGFGEYAGIKNQGGEISLDYVDAHDNDGVVQGTPFGSGFVQEAGTSTVNNSIFERQQYGVLYTGGLIALSGNSFQDNNRYGLYSSVGETLDARNSWWGSDTGPYVVSTTSPAGMGDGVGGNVLYDPWVQRGGAVVSAPAPVTKDPVIIVPGIASSILDLSNGFEAWPNLPLMTGPLDLYLDTLMMDQNGLSLTPLTPVGIFESASSAHFFDLLISQLNQVGYTKGQSLFEYSYDWRLDLSQTAVDLKKEIDTVKTQTGASKVDVVAHSMGGLLVKKYLKDYGGDSIGTFVDIATPHLGAPKAFKILNYGDDLGFNVDGLSILNETEVKKIAQNIPAVYELLPSKKYVDSSPIQTNYIVNQADKSGRLNFDATETYLKDQGRNASLLDQAQSFHAQVDDVEPKDDGITTYNIVGCGSPTFGQFYLLGKKSDGGDDYDIHVTNGDTTVPVKSAEAMKANKTFFVKNASHSRMPSVNGVKELVASLLTGNELDPSTYPNLVSKISDCKIPNGQVVSFHSPIDLSVTDSAGNHAGPNADGEIEDTIPNSDYEVFDSDKFVFLPEGQTYTVTGHSTGSGTFDVRIETIVDEEVATTTIFNDVPLTPETKTTLTVGSQPPMLLVDEYGNGTYPVHEQPTSITQGEVSGIYADPPALPVPPLIPSTVPFPSGGSSRPALPVTVPSLLMPTSTPVKVLAPLIALPDKVKNRPPQVSRKNNSHKASSPKPPQTAAVYQSFTASFMAFFKRFLTLFLSPGYAQNGKGLNS